MSDSDDVDDVLPVNDSLFERVAHEVGDTSTDTLLEDSFSSVVTSTPQLRKQRRNSLTRAATPDPSSPQPGSSRRLSRACSPGPSGYHQSRSRARAATPEVMTPRTRSQTRAATPEVSSPRTRSQTRAATPEVMTPRTRSQTRAATPEVSSPQTRSQTRAVIPEVMISRTSSRTRAVTPELRPQTTTQRKLKCPLCPALLANPQTFAAHKRRHALKRSFAKAATWQDFVVAMPELVRETLSKVVQEPCIGTLALKVKDFTEALLNSFHTAQECHQSVLDFLGNKLFTILSNHSSIFSSSLQHELLVGVNKLLNDPEFRTTLKSLLLGIELTIPVVESEVLNVFIGDFMLQLSSFVIIFYVRKIHGLVATDEIRRKRSNDKIDSETFLQLAYHIGGSIVSGFQFKASKFKSASWKSFSVILENKFLRVQAVGNACVEKVTQFTDSIDRGGLSHISQEALDFFVVSFDLLMSLEGEDGSLPPNVVDDFVVKDDTVLTLWDELVGSDLSEDHSMDFLEQILNSCKMVVLKGIMKRRLNENLKKAISSIPLRSRIA